MVEGSYRRNVVKPYKEYPIASELIFSKWRLLQSLYSLSHTAIYELGGMINSNSYTYIAHLHNLVYQSQIAPNFGLS